MLQSLVANHHHIDTSAPTSQPCPGPAVSTCNRKKAFIRAIATPFSTPTRTSSINHNYHHQHHKLTQSPSPPPSASESRSNMCVRVHSSWSIGKYLRAYWATSLGALSMMRRLMSCLFLISRTVA